MKTDLYWLSISAVLLLPAIYVATCRQLLAAFSRRLLFESAPQAEHEEIEKYLEHEDEYIASLRSADLLLRLSVVLSFAMARFQGSGGPGSFGSGLLQFLLMALVIIAVFIVFLEVIPGIAARIRPEEKLRRILKRIDAIHRFMAPIRAIPAGLIQWGVALLGGEVRRPSADILEEEILSAAEEGEREGLLASRDIDMIESIITFGNVEVSEVMTPRTEMVCLDLDDPLDHNIARAIECGHSRIPVYRGSKDNITGILYVKDLLRFWGGPKTRPEDPALQGGGPRAAENGAPFRLEDVVRKPHFVSLTKKIGELFQEFKTQRFHIAIILDEFGGTLGLITIEDIIEEIVGEISDEHEKVEKPPFKRLGPDTVEVDGSYHIDDLNDQLGLDIPEGVRYDTIGGFLASHMGKIPSVGEVFDLDSVRFEVIAADQRRIKKLRIVLPAKAESSAETETGKVDTKSGG